ncbi:DNA mismatch endonuclease Vsr [Mariprofundus erugo]|nr:DNA mismatch endonuclease Vsr [Mariprofundus erugo]
MVDRMSANERSNQMRLIKSKNTKPELLVRRLCRQLGYKGYRLHRKDLHGKPDIAFIGKKQAIFVHGCFWHGHDCHGKVRMPKTRQDYWLPKISRNKARDEECLALLKEEGWKVLVVWECETKKPDALVAKLEAFLSG